MAMAILFVLNLLVIPSLWQPAQAGNPALVAAGRRVYETRKCATCHMVAGEGNIRFRLDGAATRLSEGDLRRWLTDAAAMERALPTQPAVRMSEWLKMNRKISDVDLAALVAYLATLK